MLYKIVYDKDCVELNPGILAIEEFAKLTDRQFRFVALTADRKSPLRTLPEKARREKAALISGCKMEGTRLDRNGRALVAGEVASVEKAIVTYKSYQFNEQQDSLDATNALIRTNREFINGVNNRSADEKKLPQYGKDLKLANEFVKELPELEAARIKLEEVLQITVENRPEIQTYTAADLPQEIEGAEGLSVIDQFHLSNRKE